MDIKVRIEDVITQKGLTKKEVAERMGKFNQAFNSLITNPKWDTIELVAQAIGISTEELLFGTNKQSTDNLIKSSEEFSETKEIETIGVLVCPHCGKGIKISIQ